MYSFNVKNSSISNNSVYHNYAVCQKYLFQGIQFSQKVQFQFQTIQFSISTQFSYILPIDRSLSGVTNPSQSGLGNDGNEEVLRIPRSSRITGTSDCLVSYLGHSLRGSYLSAEVQSVYSTAPADWAVI